MSFSVITDNLSFLMQGLLITLKVAFISIILSMLFGTVLGIIRFIKTPVLSQIAGVFIDVTRSIPLILYIIFVHFTISPYLYQHADFLRYIGVDCLEMYSALIAIAAFTSAYIAEIIRSGLASVEKDQILAAKSLGLSRFQMLESVVLPQALTRMKPALCAQFITLIKDTSLASAIGLIELTRASEIVYETSFHEFQILAFVALVYVAINFLVQKMFYPRGNVLKA
jgi:putative glutamine transport system permease protein